MLFRLYNTPCTKYNTNEHHLSSHGFRLDNTTAKQPQYRQLYNGKTKVYFLLELLTRKVQSFTQDKIMAKLIYENDAGHQVTFEIAEDFAKTLESEVGINVWNVFTDILKTEMLARPQGDTV